VSSIEYLPNFSSIEKRVKCSPRREARKPGSLYSL